VLCIHIDVVHQCKLRTVSYIMPCIHLVCRNLVFFHVYARTVPFQLKCNNLYTMKTKIKIKDPQLNHYIRENCIT
jgi:hypothetical protein